MPAALEYIWADKIPPKSVERTNTVRESEASPASPNPLGFALGATSPASKVGSVLRGKTDLSFPDIYTADSDYSSEWPDGLACLLSTMRPAEPRPEAADVPNALMVPLYTPEEMPRGFGSAVVFDGLSDESELRRRLEELARRCAELLSDGFNCCRILFTEDRYVEYEFDVALRPPPPAPPCRRRPRWFDFSPPSLLPLLPLDQLYVSGNLCLATSDFFPPYNLASGLGAVEFKPFGGDGDWPPAPDCSRAEDGLPCRACAAVCYARRGGCLGPWIILSGRVTYFSAPPIQFLLPQPLSNNHPQATASQAAHAKSTPSQAPHAPTAKSSGPNARRKLTSLPQRK